MRLSPYDRVLIDAIKKDRKEHQIKDFNLRYIHVKHQDGSDFKITHVKLERTKLKLGKREVDILLVYSEHNGVFLFIECDLESVFIKPWKGRKYKLKINNTWIA